MCVHSWVCRASELVWSWCWQWLYSNIFFLNAFLGQLLYILTFNFHIFVDKYKVEYQKKNKKKKKETKQKQKQKWPLFSDFMGQSEKANKHLLFF